VLVDWLAGDELTLWVWFLFLSAIFWNDRTRGTALIVSLLVWLVHLPAEALRGLYCGL